MKKMVLVYLCVGVFFATGILEAAEIVITAKEGKELMVPYCWRQGEEIKFESPGGNVGIKTSEIQFIEERIYHSERDAVYLRSKAVASNADVLSIMKEYLAKKSGLDIQPFDKALEEAAPKGVSKGGASSSDANMIAPATKLYDSFEQAYKKPDGDTILTAAFVNAREDLTGRKCYIKLIDVNKRYERKPLVVQRLSVPQEQRRSHKISNFFYVIYGYVPASSSFWSYDITCDVKL